MSKNLIPRCCFLSVKQQRLDRNCDASSSTYQDDFNRQIAPAYAQPIVGIALRDFGYLLKRNGAHRIAPADHLQVFHYLIVPLFEGLYRFAPVAHRRAQTKVDTCPYNHHVQCRGSIDVGLNNDQSSALVSRGAMCILPVRRPWNVLTAGARNENQKSARHPRLR